MDLAKSMTDPPLANSTTTQSTNYEYLPILLIHTQLVIVNLIFGFMDSTWSITILLSPTLHGPTYQTNDAILNSFWI